MLLELFTLPNFLFTIIITALGVYGTFLSTKGSLTDNRRKWYDPLTKRGKILLIVSLFGLFVLWLQDFNSKRVATNEKVLTDSISRSKDILLTKEKDSRDSTITSRVDTGIKRNTKQLFEDLSKAFAEQGLKIDTLNGRIKQIKDSSQTNKIDPVLQILNPNTGATGFAFDGYDKNKMILKIWAKSLDAGCCCLNIIASAIGKTRDGKFEYLSKHPLFDNTARFHKDASYFQRIYIDTVYVEVYLWFRGSYKNVDQTKAFQMNDLLSYDLQTKETAIINYDERILLINAINKKEKE